MGASTARGPPPQCSPDDSAGGEMADGGISLSGFAGFTVMFAVLTSVCRSATGARPTTGSGARHGASALGCHVALRLTWCLLGETAVRPLKRSSSWTSSSS